MANISIRLRLTLWYSTVLLLGLALFGTAMSVALEHHLMAGVDSRLNQRVEGLRTVLETESGITDRKQLEEELAEFVHAIPEGSFTQLRDAAGALLPLGYPITLTSDHPVYTTDRRDGHAVRVLTTRIQRGAKSYDALVASSLADLESVMKDFRQLLLLMIPAVLALACSGGYWISRRALAPVDEITRVAQSISVQNLAQRLLVPRTGDELERMSEAWNEVLERLDSAVKRIRQFTADASHELRTPLAFMRGTAELALRRDRTASEYQKSLRDILGETERMTELTESLLALARADDGITMALSPTDLNAIIEDVVRQSQGVADSLGIVLKAETVDCAVAPANESAIRRLLLTLIDNALKHTQRGGVVTVSTAQANHGVTLAVQDTGEGIEPEALPHIFERFFRADTARSSGSGVGLGLSIAQAIAHAHGSQIGVESQPGAGARFALVLRG